MNRLKANMLLMLTAMIWGTAFVAQHTSMENIGPHFFTGIRFLLGGLVVLPFGLREYGKNKSQSIDLSLRDFLGMCLCGLFIFLASILQQIGIELTSVTNAGFLTGLYVPLVPLMLLVFWRKLPHWSIWPSVMGCLVGTYYLSGGNLSRLSTGDYWMIIAAVFWALQIIAVGFVVRTSKAPLLLAAVQFIVCGLLGVLSGFIFETFSFANIMNAGFEILYAGVLSVGVAFTLQAVAQTHTGQADAAIIMSGETLFAALAAAVILGERLNFMGYFGCAVIFISILSVELLPLWRRKTT